MKRIYKYALAVTGSQTVVMPSSARPLCVQLQNGIPCLWALVDDLEPGEKWTVHVFGTGHPIPDADRLLYVSTFQFFSGDLVFHVFVAGPVTEDRTQ